MKTWSLPQWRQRQGNGRSAPKGRFDSVECLGGMDIYHKNPRFICNQWEPIIQARFDVDRLALNREAKVMVEFVLVRPLWTRFTHFINGSSPKNVLEHETPNVFECNVAEFLTYPAVRLFRQIELDVIREIPVPESVSVRCQSSGVCQRRHLSLPIDSGSD
jgi:hypothetical protein